MTGTTLPKKPAPVAKKPGEDTQDFPTVKPM